MKRTFRFKAGIGLIGCEVTKILTFDFDDEASGEEQKEEVDEALEDWAMQQLDMSAEEVAEGTKR